MGVAPWGKPEDGDRTCPRNALHNVSFHTIEKFQIFCEFQSKQYAVHCTAISAVSNTMAIACTTFLNTKNSGFYQHSALM